MRQLSQVELAQFLIEKADQYAKFSFVQDDPIQIPHAFSSAEDIEIVLSLLLPFLGEIAKPL